jgi:hypothetical protein
MMRILLSILAVAYPALMFVLLVVLKAPVRFISLFVIAMGLSYFLLAGSRNGPKKAAEPGQAKKKSREFSLQAFFSFSVQELSALLPIQRWCLSSTPC